MVRGEPTSKGDAEMAAPRPRSAARCREISLSLGEAAATEIANAEITATTAKEGPMRHMVAVQLSGENIRHPSRSKSTSAATLQHASDGLLLGTANSACSHCMPWLGSVMYVHTRQTLGVEGHYHFLCDPMSLGVPVSVLVNSGGPIWIHQFYRSTLVVLDGPVWPCPVTLE